jgi:hypothetical protein
MNAPQAPQASSRAGKKRRGRKKREGKREGFLVVWSMHSGISDVKLVLNPRFCIFCSYAKNNAYHTLEMQKISVIVQRQIVDVQGAV